MMKKEKTKLIDLFFAFSRIGLFTFGGGYAALPMLEAETVKRHAWVSEEEMLDYYAVSQMTPGIIMINVATFIGYKERGVIGGIVATLGVITPCLIIITTIATFIQNFASIKFVQSALKGISASVCAIILVSLINLGKKSIKNIFGIVLALVGFVISYFTDISIVVVVVVAILAGILKNKLEVKNK